MAIFQPRPFQVPSLRTDYSAENSAWQNLGKTLGDLPGDLRKQQLEQQKQQLLGSLTSGNPDYAKVGLGLLALGDTQGGAAVIGLGQKQQAMDSQKSIANIFGGGSSPSVATPSAAPAPAPLGAGLGLGVGNGSAAAKPFVRPVQVAENEEDTQRLEAEMERRAQLGYGNPNLPAGMRNNNPGNIKFVSQGQAPGVVGPSQNTDQGDPQAVFNSPEAGMSAAYDLALRKYQGGKRTANDLIAGQGGWTPGNTAAAANVAKGMGIGPNDDLRLDDPARAQAFLRSLIAQEHGKSGGLYDGGMIASAVGARGGQSSPQIAQAAPEAQPPEQGNPVQLRADAQYYENSNPEAARQMRARADALEQGQPVQMAQAAPVPGAPVADAPAPGAANAGFNPPGANMLPPNDPMPGVPSRALMGVIANPNASDGQRLLAKTVLDARQKYSDENAPDKRALAKSQAEKADLETRKLRQEVEGEGTRPMTAEERKAYNVQDGQSAYFKRNGEPGFGPAGTVIKNEGNLPPGYRAVRDANGNLERVEPIPGSKAEREANDLAEKKVKADRLKSEVGTTVGNALDDIDRLMKSATLPTTGAMGARVASIPGTAAYDISQALGTIGANISFSQLQQMRESSPTGGALGNVTEGEQKMLQNSFAALSQSQSPEQFKTNIGRVRAVFERIVHGRTLSPQERKTGGPMTIERAKGLRDQAAEAIAGGAPKDAVLKRLKEDYGITADGL